MWHASVSAQQGHLLNLPGIVEKEAAKLLTGVGGDHEWWVFTLTRVGHLRVPVTSTEHNRIPPELVVADAGDAGPKRQRTKGPRR